MSKKLSVVLMIFLVLFSVTMPVFATELYEDSFETIYQNATVDLLYENNILEINKEKPLVINEDVVKVLYNIEEIFEVHLEEPKSVKFTREMSDELKWMYTHLNLSEDLLDKFVPSKPVTKEDLAIFLYTYAKHVDLKMESENVLETYSDYEIVSEKARDALSWCFSNSLLNPSYEVNQESVSFHLHSEAEMNTIIGADKIITLTQFEAILVQYMKLLATTPTYGEEIVETARYYLGCDYVWGGCGPTSFDCSGFVYFVFKSLDYNFPGLRDGAGRLSESYGRSIIPCCLDEDAKLKDDEEFRIDWSEVPPGAVIGFDWDGDGSADHVGIWTGENSLIHASGGPTSQYARNGYMIEEAFLGEGNGSSTSKSYKFDKYLNSICAVRSYDTRRK